METKYRCMLALVAFVATDMAAAASVSGVPAFSAIVEVKDATTGDLRVGRTIALDQMGSPTPVPGKSTLFNYNSQWTADNDSWFFGWDINADPDPTIGGSFTLINTSSVTEDFDITLNLPVNVLFSPAEISGSVSATLSETSGTTLPGSGVPLGGSTTETTFGPTAANAGGTGLVTGQINGSDVLNLGAFNYDSLFSGPAAATGTVIFAQTVAPQVYGPGIPDTGAPGVSGESISIRLQFSLSAGDTIDFTTRFDVLPLVVPVPAAGFLAVPALALLGGMTRRRS